LEIYLRAVAFAVGSFVVLTGIPIIAKWVLIGTWKAETIPIWSLRYFRFWVVKTLIRSAPVVVFYGSPIYSVYLRLLGARIGPNVVVECRSVPGCTDLIAIGENTILRKDSILLGYRAQANFIHTGPVEIGSNAFVGEASVLDIGPVMGNNTQPGMPPPCGAASASRTASAITAPPRRRRRPTTARSQARLALPSSAGSSTRCSSWFCSPSSFRCRFCC